MKIELKQKDPLDRFQEYASAALEGGYVFTAENKKVISGILNNFLEHKRGSMILGEPGSGKTLIYEFLARITHPLDPRNFRIRSCVRIQDDFSQPDQFGGHEIFKNYRRENFMFDDLGVERKAKHFGETLEVMEHMIYQRYDAWRYNHAITHFTSNLGYDDILARYGLRCISRLEEFCDVFVLGEGSGFINMRKKRNFICFPEVVWPSRALPEPSENLSGGGNIPHARGLGGRLKDVLQSALPGRPLS